jgi:hypothetical protein
MYFRILLLFLLLPLSLYSREETLEIKDSVILKTEVKPFKIIPRQATIKSAIIPGWGQLYNRQYWKLPLVAGSFVTLGLIANWNNVRYTKYREYYYIVSPRVSDPKYIPPATIEDLMKMVLSGI